MRLVLDTSVMVSAIRSNSGASNRILRLALARPMTVAISNTLLAEYEAVMTRTEHRLASGLSVDEIRKVIDAIAAVSHHVVPAFRLRPILSDPDDDMVLEAAVNGGANAIVTHNQRDFLPQAAIYGVAVLSPGAALRAWKEQ
jgi:putative PIN family toxin of toxin-antitoxin system